MNWVFSHDVYTGGRKIDAIVCSIKIPFISIPSVCGYRRHVQRKVYEVMKINCNHWTLGTLFQCTTLNDKLNQLLKTLSIESEALPTPAKEDLRSESSESSSDCGPNNNSANNGKQKVFVPRDALMSRANSLKKALKQIIEHTEKGLYRKIS